MLNEPTQEKRYVDVKTSDFENQIPDFNLLIITATEIEKKTLHSYMKPAPGNKQLMKIFSGAQTYYAGLFGSYLAIHVNCDKMGAVSPGGSILTTEKAIQFCKPKAVLMPGIAMGMNKTKQKVGDVLVSEFVSGYDIQRVGENETIHRGVSGQASLYLLNRFKSVTDWAHKIKRGQPKIIYGEVLSGEKLIDNSEYKKLLLSHFPEAKGGEMEGYGVHSTCLSNNTPWILVKAICDYGDGQKKRNKDNNQKEASNSAINLCHHVFNSEEAFGDLGIEPYCAKAVTTPPVKELDPLPYNIESIIITEMMKATNNEPVAANDFLMDIAMSFLKLNDVQKIDIAKRLKIYDDSLLKLYTDKRNIEIFARVKASNLISDLQKELMIVATNQ